MRIAFVNRIAWPDEGATALYLTELAEALAAAGHEVHVVCGSASYRPAAGARGPSPRRRRGVVYHRVPGRRGQGTLARALASALFLARAAMRLLRVPPPDVVVGLTDPPFVDVVGGAVARVRGARFVPWVMDLYPDVAVAAGVLREGSLAHRGLGLAMGAALRRASAVVVLGAAMRRPVLARGVPRKRVRVIENWAPAEVEEAAARPAPPRPERPFTLLYSGNYGVAHDLGPLLDRLRSLPAGVPARLVLRVSGARVEALRRDVEGLPIPVLWREPVETGRLAASLLEGDLHVVCVRKGFERLLVPSKVHAPLALGLPVLLVGPGARRLAPRGARDVALVGAPAPLASALSDPGLSIVARAAGTASRERSLAEWVRLLEGVRPRTRVDHRSSRAHAVRPYRP